jgi:hypothetical protein
VERKIAVKLPDGKSIEAVAFVTTPLMIAEGISKSLVSKTVAAKVCVCLKDDSLDSG